MAPGLPPSPPPRLSVLLPVYNEEACIASVLREIASVLHGLGIPFEIIAIDDGSTDTTPARLQALRTEIPQLRILRLAANAGQTAALGTAIRAARGDVLATLDADGQNDPSDIPALLAHLDHCDVCCGYRAHRKDVWSKRAASRIANALRNLVLRETIRDVGCTLKVFRAAYARSLPIQFRGMHRFLTALIALEGARIEEIPVNHRPRATGQSKYTNWGRLKETLWDLWAVRWMQKRHRVPCAKEL